MKKDDNTFERLIDFLNNEFGVKKNKLSLKTTLEKDLGITGDEGVEFLDKFTTLFDIKYNKDKEWQSYFHSEGFGLIDFVAIYNKLRGKKHKPVYDLTLEHLIKVIELGYWVDLK